MLWESNYLTIKEMNNGKTHLCWSGGIVRGRLYCFQA